METRLKKRFITICKFHHGMQVFKKKSQKECMDWIHVWAPSMASQRIYDTYNHQSKIDAKLHVNIDCKVGQYTLQRNTTNASIAKVYQVGLTFFISSFLYSST